jgi:hypothetical protein
VEDEQEDVEYISVVPASAADQAARLSHRVAPPVSGCDVQLPELLVKLPGLSSCLARGSGVAAAAVCDARDLRANLGLQRGSRLLLCL